MHVCVGPSAIGFIEEIDAMIAAGAALETRQARSPIGVLMRMAGAAGFEPATYGFGDRRSTN